MSLAQDKFSRRPTSEMRAAIFDPAPRPMDAAVDETDPAASNDGHLIRPTGTLMHTPMALSVNLGTGRHSGSRDRSVDRTLDLWIGNFDTDAGLALCFRWHETHLLIDHIRK